MTSIFAPGDAIEFAANLLPEELLLTQNQDDLILRFPGTSDQITVQRYFLSPNYRIEQFHFTDGTVWNTTAIEARMAAQGGPICQRKALIRWLAHQAMTRWMRSAATTPSLAVLVLIRSPVARGAIPCWQCRQ